jgi:imidazole glycerol-phosphate synthase subunit HisH
VNVPRVCILDYGSGNVGSVFNLVSMLAKDVRVSNAVNVLRDASHLILPGVGAYGAALEKIRNRIPLEALEEEVLRKRKPFLGICVGMQVLGDKGYEFGEHAGFGWIPGEVRLLKSGSHPLPHIGWNDILPKADHPLFSGCDSNRDFYFVHSYVFHPRHNESVLATTEYGETFVSAIHQENVLGVQFHPEKSQKAGRRLIRNFLERLS